MVKTTIKIKSVKYLKKIVVIKFAFSIHKKKNLLAKLKINDQGLNCPWHTVEGYNIAQQSD